MKGAAAFRFVHPRRLEDVELEVQVMVWNVPDVAIAGPETAAPTAAQPEPEPPAGDGGGDGDIQDSGADDDGH